MNWSIKRWQMGDEKDTKGNLKGLKHRKGEMTRAKVEGYNAKKDLQEAAAQVNEAVNDYLLPITTDMKLDNDLRADVATATVKLQMALRWLEAWGAGTEPVRLY